MENKHKICIKCGKKFPLTSKYFYNCKRNVDGLNNWCKKCALKNRSEYRKNNRKMWRNNNKEKITTENKVYRDNNKEKEAARTKKWYENNKERRNKVQKEWRENNKERIAAKNKEWYKNNKEKAKCRKHRYRARKANAEGSHTDKEWDSKVVEYNNRCAYCGVTLEENSSGSYNPNGVTKEHVIALENDGSNYINNLVPACRICNDRKGTKLNYKKPKIFAR